MKPFDRARGFLPFALAVLLLVGPGCSDDDDGGSPAGGGADPDPVVLVLGDGRSETHVSATLSAAGFEVRDGGLFHDYTGSGLVTTEWLGYSIERSDDHQILDPILPVRYGGTYGTGAETLSVLVDHPVTENLPASFSTESVNQYSVVAPRSGATQLVRGSRSGAAVVTWTKGGRVVSLNMAGEYGGTGVWNADLDRLVVDATGFAARR